MRVLRAMCAVCIVTWLAGCSAYMAANQPGPKELSLFTKGTPRAKLIAEFGPPINTETKNGARVDIFKFTHGYSSGVRAGRAILHGAADVATLGLWEIVGTPTEGYMNGTQLSAEVTYDAQDTVAVMTPLAGEDELKRGTANPQPVAASEKTAR